MKVITIIKVNRGLFIFVKFCLGIEMLHPYRTSYTIRGKNSSRDLHTRLLYQDKNQKSLLSTSYKQP
jgi:hypothetical protein